MKNSIKSALFSTIYYYGMEDFIKELYFLKPNNYGQLSKPLHYIKSHELHEEILTFIWSILVLLFGDYGTSPRTGWIEQIDEFRKFIHEALEEYRMYESLEEAENGDI